MHPLVPRPTNGHHFDAYLQCPQRAYLDYFGDPARKAPDPPYLRALQNEGLQHEREVSTRLYPEAVRIPSSIPPAERFRRTVNAMRSGAGAILQGYLLEPDACGITDVLELDHACTDSPTGHRYRIGEFKRAAALSTGHVLQATWYNELLGRIQGTPGDEVIFVMGDGVRQTVNLAPVMPVYRQVKQSLLALRNSKTEPGAHLSRSCMSCPWREACIPNLVNEQHVSLLPGINRRHATALEELGVHTWHDALQVPENRMLALGFDASELRRMHDAACRIREGRVVFRQAIRSEMLRNMTAVSVEFDALGERRRSESKPSPHIVWFEQGREIRQIALSGSGTGAWPHELIHASGSSGLAFFGTTDVDAFSRLAQAPAREKPPCMDVLGIVEQWVHVPFTGLELSSISSFIGHRLDAASPSGGRVQAIRALLDWMSDRRAAAS